MFFDYPEKKDFEKVYKLNYKKSFVLRFGQSTISEFTDFFKKNDLEKDFYLNNLIFACIYGNGFRYFLRKIGFKKKIEKYLNIEEMKREILQNKFKNYESKFSGLTKGDTKKTESLFSFYLVLFFQNYGLKPKEVMELTLEQFSYLMDGVIYYTNLKTKEGQNINQIALGKKAVDKDKFKKNKEYFEKKKNGKKTE